MISALFTLLRPTQWLKNLMLLFPPFLGGAILVPGLAGRAVVPVAAFCLGSSASYLVNDVMDREKDALHPRKKGRPVASGKVPISIALGLAACCLFASLYLASRVSFVFFSLLVAYFAITFAYSLRLKQIAVVDLFCISSGFLLRLKAGGEAFGIEISDWLFLSVFLLAVFLSTGKRLSEKKALGEGAHGHRTSLLGYPAGVLEGTMYLTGSAVLVTYTQYVIVRHVMVYTVPLCCFGLLRFIVRVQSGKGGDPTESLLKDPTLCFAGIAWAVMVALGIYAR